MGNNIAGKAVVITGASSGLGEATARLLAAQDASVALGARRVDRLKSLAGPLTQGNGKAIAVATDVTDSHQMKQLMDKAVQAFGRIDVMINNAGLMPHSPLERLKIDDWNRTIDVNIKGVLYGIAAALPCMKEQKAGQSSMSLLSPDIRLVPEARSIRRRKLQCGSYPKDCARK
jgi:NADP-dependent 3-hydroxy acid dehydrogenase YdfG